MEKIIEIDGKSVRLKSTAATPMRYKNQFGKDYFSDLLTIAKTTSSFGTGENDNNQESESKELDLNKLSYEDLSRLDMTVMYNLVWAFAKTADKTIDTPLEWLDGFDEFPINIIFPQVTELLESSLKSQKK